MSTATLPTALRRAALGDSFQALADLDCVLAEIVEPRQLRECLEAEDALEQLRGAIANGTAETRLTTRLDDEPALDEPRNDRVGCNAADPGDVGTRARAEIGDDGERLERCLGEPTLDGPLDEAPTRSGLAARRPEGVAAAASSSTMPLRPSA